MNRTSELLTPSPVRTVPDSALLAAPAGPPVGIVEAPSSPPSVPPREADAAPCVRSSDGQVSVAATISGVTTRPSPPRELSVAGSPVTVRWHFPPGEGALVGPLDLDRPREPGSDPADAVEGIRLVDGGVGYPFGSREALRALGYRREQTVLLPAPWLSLLAPGAPLTQP